MMGAILNWVRASWDAVRTSLWLIPGIMFVLGGGLAVVLLRSDPGAAGAEWHAWVSAGNGEDARNLLSTLLAGVIAMASIVFSVTVLSLSLAASAYGPRLVRTFRASRRSQLVLGFFIMTIVYLLLVLRSIRGEASPAQVPEIAVAAGSALALACVIALLAFVQSVANLMVADEVVRRVRRELDSAIKNLPTRRHRQPRSPDVPEDFESVAGRIRLPREGYVQSVDYSGLVRWAEKNDAIVRLDVRPGDFVVEGDHKVLVHPAPSDPDGARREIDKFIVSGDERTPTQDLEFAVRHLVEIAVRALSPGINDPFTAIAVVDRLRGAIARLSARDIPEAMLIDPLGRLRIIRKVTSYGGFADAALNQIREAASRTPAVLIHILQAIGAIAEHTGDEEQRRVLVRHAGLAKAAAERDVGEAADLADVNAAYDEALRAIETARTA